MYKFILICIYFYTWFWILIYVYLLKDFLIYSYWNERNNKLLDYLIKSRFTSLLIRGSHQKRVVGCNELNHVGKVTCVEGKVDETEGCDLRKQWEALLRKPIDCGFHVGGFYLWCLPLFASAIIKILVIWNDPLEDNLTSIGKYELFIYCFKISLKNVKMEIRRNRENNLGGTFTCLGKHVVGSCMVMVGEDDFNSFPDVADSTHLIGQSPFINVFTTSCFQLMN